MITASNSLFDTVVLGQPISFRAPSNAPAKTVPKSKASQAPVMSASLWRHTANECKAARSHGRVVRSLCGLLGGLSIASVAAAAWQMHALLSGSRLHDAVSAFLH